MRGGEKVLLALARLFPEAPIFTLLHVKGSVAPELEAREIRTTFENNAKAVFVMKVLGPLSPPA